MQLVAPAGHIGAFKAAINAGADAIYIGFKGISNARQFPGLNFSRDEIRQAIDLAHRAKRQIYIALNTYPQQDNWPHWLSLLKDLGELNVDAVILADLGLLSYVREHLPTLNCHLSVQASATTPPALNLYHDLGVRRAVLPRVLSLSQVQMLATQTEIELEVFAFGSLCIMVEGRCYLSSYLTDESPNKTGACSPAKDVRWQETDGDLHAYLNNTLIDVFTPGEPAGYPTLCKGRFDVGTRRFHAIEEPVSLNTLNILPDLARAGVRAIKIEGRQRSAKYIEQVVTVFRRAIDAYYDGCAENYDSGTWREHLTALSEGGLTTLGALDRGWQ